MTTRQDIQEWVERGRSSGLRWLIVVCDTFDYEDYPVYANTVEEFDKAYNSHNNTNMQRIMEVYDLDGDIQSQMSQSRSFAYPEQSRFNPNRQGENPLVKWLDSSK
jgi:hypothetical protein